MSLAELLPAIRALPQADRIRLIHELVDMVARPDLPDDEQIRAALLMQAIHSSEGFEFAAGLQQLITNKNSKI